MQNESEGKIHTPRQFFLYIVAFLIARCQSNNYSRTTHYHNIGAQANGNPHAAESAGATPEALFLREHVREDHQAHPVRSRAAAAQLCLWGQEGEVRAVRGGGAPRLLHTLGALYCLCEGRTVSFVLLVGLACVAAWLVLMCIIIWL
jgi:hypothetical protein